MTPASLMQDSVDAINLKPPRPGRWSMPMVLALAAHLVLIAALTWGVTWKEQAEPVAFEAELWSAVAQQAAPRAVKTPPPPPPEPKGEPKVQPPAPEPKAEPEPPDTREADIATAQAKKKKEEAEKRAADKLAAKEKAEKARLEREKRAKDKAEKAKQAKAEAQKRAAEEKQRKAQLAKEQAEASKAAREEQLRRMMGQAGATGDAKATGSAQRSSGPSASYGGRVRARVKPNVLLTDDIPGNPAAEVEVRTAPDGTIVSRRLIKSSGNADWDKAALAAIDRTGIMPRDVDGRVPSPMIIELRPRD